MTSYRNATRDLVYRSAVLTTDIRTSTCRLIETIALHLNRLPGPSSSLME